MYLRQLNIQPEITKWINGGNCPCLVGEFGCHMDLNNGKCYKKWDKGKRDWKVFKWQVIAMDLMYNALDELLLSSTQWNYTADNNNKFGDNWNQEDLSLFSRDQQLVDWRKDINSGGRAIPGFCRPYVRCIAGTPRLMKFNRKKGTFLLEFEADEAISAPTEVYIPLIQYPKGFEVHCTDAEWSIASDEPLLFITHPKRKDITLKITRKK